MKRTPICFISNAPKNHQCVSKPINKGLHKKVCQTIFHYLELVYDRNHYFGFGPIPKPKLKLVDTFGPQGMR